MSTDANEWDEDLINDIFTVREANLILLIPLQRLRTDSWYWRKENMGFYSVKSAYAMLRDQKEVQHSSDSSGFWRKLWNLKVPLKVKHFLWRAVSGSLPTKDLLISRRVEVNRLCPVCNLAHESAFHVLVNCDFAKLCWNKSGYISNTQDYSNFADWMDGIFQKYNSEGVRTISMVCWSLWKNRNDIVWNQKSTEVTAVVESAILVLNQWQSAQDRSFDSSLGFITPSDGNEHWQLPQVNTVKVNTDAALFEDSGHYSFSMLARDHEGNMLEAKACCKQGSVAPELAEAIGIREALSWVKSKEWPKVIVETDCLMVQAIRCSSVGQSYFGRVIDECKQHLSDLRGRNVTLIFVKRSANKVAHYLARYTSSLADRIWKRGDVHPDFMHVLLNDLKS